MILGNTKIDILVTKVEEIFSTNVNCMIRYLPNIKFIKEYEYNYEKIINCEIPKEDKIYIRDLQGWTLLLGVEKFILPEKYKYYSINNDIFVSEDEFIPIYNSEAYNTGFHGTLLYQYESTNIKDVKDNSEMRIALNDFIKVNISEYDNKENIGYRIRTNAGMFSIGESNIQLFGGISKKNKYY